LVSWIYNIHEYKRRTEPPAAAAARACSKDKMLFSRFLGVKLLFSMPWICNALPVVTHLLHFVLCCCAALLFADGLAVELALWLEISHLKISIIIKTYKIKRKQKV
jgi:hypothetical protein